MKLVFVPLFRNFLMLLEIKRLGQVFKQFKRRNYGVFRLLQAIPKHPFTLKQ